MQSPDTDRIRTETGWEVKCAHCGKWFESKRSDAAFHDARCRNRHKREYERLLDWIENLEPKAREIEAYAKRFKNSKRMFDALDRYHKSVGRSLDWFEE